MKKVLIILGVILVVLLGAAAILPVIFKDDIRKEIDKQLASSVNADVYFEDFGVTLFRNFPGLTVYMTEFGVTGRDEFEGLPLLGMESFELEINLWSLVFGDQIKINGISLASPQIYVKVLEDGTANYDIAISSDSVSVEEESSGDTQFSIGIDHWEISNGQVIYDDDLYKVFTRLIGLDHSGSGDFTQDVFDLRTSTLVDTLSFTYEGSEYISKKEAEVAFTITISEDYSKYEFGENSVRLNDFTFGFEGWLKMLEEGYDMDLSYNTQNNTFKSLLSLVPAEFLQDIEDLETSGNLAFDGMVKGEYAENTMPGFNLHMQVSDAMMKYPDLPTAMKDINFDLTVEHPQGDTNMYNTSLNLATLSMDLGGNPVEARLKVDDFIKMPIDGMVKAKVDLGALNSIVPIEGLEMKGIFSVDGTAKGRYDSLTGEYPSMNVAMGLQDGYIKSVEFPIPVEHLNIQAEVKNETGQMKDLWIHVPNINMVMGEEKLSANATVRNMDDYEWDVSVHGAINLDNVMKIYPLEGTTLAGIISADMDTKGKMSDLDAGRYDRLPTSGKMTVRGLSYQSADLPQGMTISEAAVELTPEQMKINTYKGTLGKSDIQVSGTLSNYMGYALKENEILKGNLVFNSGTFDVNEWMTETESDVEEVSENTEEVELEVAEIPGNIDFTMNSRINTLYYDNLTIKNMQGQIVIRDGILRMNRVNFNTLGGQFAMTGSYSTKDIEHPSYDFDVDIKELSFSESYAAFNTVRVFAPVANLIDGQFSTNFNVNGELKPDMMPDLTTLNLDGLFQIAQAALIKSDILDGISSVTSLDPKKAGKVTLKDVIMKTSIENGRIKVDPFKLKLGDYDAELGGSYGIDKRMDYKLTVDVPAGELGSQLNSALASLTGTDAASGSDIIKLPVNIGGSYTKPTFKVGTAEATKAVTDQAKSAVKEKADEEADKLKEEAKKEAEELKKKAKDKLKKLFKGG